MSIYSEYLVTCILFFVRLLTYLFHRFWITNLSYWKKRNVPYMGYDWIFGSIREQILKRKSWSSFVNDCYKAFKENGYGGAFFFTEPTLFICDINLVDKVLVHDFFHFHDRMPSNMAEFLFNNLFVVAGEKWRIMRSRLVPAFSLGKVKSMFSQVFNCGDCLLEKIDAKLNKNMDIDLEPLLFEYFTEVIASCEFGVQLMSHPSECEQFKKTTDLIFNSSRFAILKGIFCTVYPKLQQLLRINIFPVQVNNFFINLTKSTIRYRKENNIQRNDFLQMMLKLKEQEEMGTEVDLTEDDKLMNYLKYFSGKPNPSSHEKIFTEDCIASLIFNFLAAGLKPTVVTTSYALFEIAKNSTIQNTLQKEIHSAITKHKGWSYEAVRDMTYLDQVLQETMRMYNFNIILKRVVTEPYKIPGTNVMLEKGITVNIPILPIHFDPQYYPSPKTFDPKRFEGNNYKPSSKFLPFGQGPRICIAIRFAVLMMKVCIARVLYKYEIRISKNIRNVVEFDHDDLYNKKIEVYLSFHEK